MKQAIKDRLKENRIVYGTYKFLQKVFLPSQKSIMDDVSKYHINRFYKYAGAFSDSEVKDSAYMTWLYHVIEKGLSMPNMRYGFGKDKILELCSLVDNFANKYGPRGTALYSAIAVIAEYKKIHIEAHYSIDSEVEMKINIILNRFPEVNPINQKCVTEQEYFSANNLPFEKFSYSRHCVRNYDPDKRIEVDEIIRAIKLAKNAPSACNRQPSRVHIITDKELMLKCLENQNGSRGFKELADKLLIITGDLRTVLGAQEFFDLNTNVGIFIMNLCYALQLEKIGCCILNWYAMPNEDKKLRKIANIPDAENIVAFIICGKVPDNFKLAESPRMETERYYTIH